MPPRTGTSARRRWRAPPEACRRRDQCSEIPRWPLMTHSFTLIGGVVMAGLLSVEFEASSSQSAKVNVQRADQTRVLLVGAEFASAALLEIGVPGANLLDGQVCALYNAQCQE